jgi:hypothetical protein
MPLRFLFVVLIAFFAAPTAAQTPFPQVALTTDRVEAVISAYGPMRERIEEIGADLEASGEAGDVAEELQALAMAGTVGSALDDAAQAYGFDGYMDWAATTYAVFAAHAFAKNPPDAEIQEALDQIESNESLTAAQKEQMKQMLLHSLGAMQAMQPSDENLAAVEPYGDQLEAVLAE